MRPSRQYPLPGICGISFKRLATLVAVAFFVWALALWPAGAHAALPEAPRFVITATDEQVANGQIDAYRLSCAAADGTTWSLDVPYEGKTTSVALEVGALAEGEWTCSAVAVNEYVANGQPAFAEGAPVSAPPFSLLSPDPGPVESLTVE